MHYPHCQNRIVDLFLVDIASTSFIFRRQDLQSQHQIVLCPELFLDLKVEIIVKYC